MIIFIPAIFLLVSAIAVLIVNRFKINIGRVWLISMVISLVNWGIILGFKWLLPLNLTNLGWFPFLEYFQESISFRLDASSWPFAFALSSIQLAILLTDSTRLEELPSLNIWPGVFVINAIGYLVVLCNSLFSVFLLWTLIDLVELFVSLLTVKSDEMANVGVISFAVKMAGTMFLIVAVFISYSNGSPLSFDHMSESVSPLVLVAIGLRLGIIPFNLPYSKEIPLRIGLGNTIRMVSAASGLVILLRITPSLFQNLSGVAFLPLFSAASFVAALMWLVSKDELAGRPYWIIALASFSIYSSILGDVTSSLLWSIDLILIGSVLFLFSEREKRILFLPLLAVIGLNGLPFTPSASGWKTLVEGGGVFIKILNIVSINLLTIGFIRHVLRPGRDLKVREKWIWVIYPAGLFFLILTQWLIFILSPFDWIQPGLIGASIVTFFLSLILFFFFRRMNRIVEYTDWLVSLLDKFGSIIISVLSLNWLYKTLWYGLRILETIVNLFSGVLESQTGIIWIFILIAVMVTIISPGVH